MTGFGVIVEKQEHCLVDKVGSKVWREMKVSKKTPFGERAKVRFPKYATFVEILVNHLPLAMLKQFFG